MANVTTIENDQTRSMTSYIDILKEAQEILFSDDKTISAKDLTFCHRRKIFSIFDRVPMTIEDLSNITIGKIADSFIKRMYSIFFDRFEFDLEIQYKKIKGFVDMYDKFTHTIIEIKTSKSFTISKPKKWDEEQIKNYMSILNCNNGTIVYSTNNFSNWKEFPIKLNLEERQKRLKKIEFDAEQILTAIDAKDPSLVPGIYPDNNLNWMCRDCPYLTGCQNFRVDDSKKFPNQYKNLFS